MRAWLLAAAAALALALPAAGQGIGPATCFQQPALVELLQQAFGATPAARGLAADGTMIEIFVNASDDRWAAVVSYPSGVSCILAWGAYWENVPIISIDPGAPS